MEKEKKTLTETELARKKKMSSRKFLVWLVWLILAFLSVVFSIIIVVITKQFETALLNFIENIFGWFFVISMMYLGINVGQKGIFAFKEYLVNKKEEQTKTEDNK